MSRRENTSKGGWRGAAGKPAAAASGRRGWQQTSAPVETTASPRRRRRIKFGLALGGLAVVAGLLIWILPWLRPPGAACLVLIGAGYEENLALPHNAHGWKGLEDLARLKRGGTSSLLSWGPSAHLRVHHGPHAVTAETKPATDIWEKAFSSFREKTIVLFFALHGGADEKGRAFLWADDPETEKRIYVDEILDKLSGPELEGKNKVLILDATQVVAHWPSGMLHNDFARQLKALKDKILQIPNLVVLCSSDVDQRSWVSEEWRQSIFTHYVIEGLRGAADGYEGVANTRVTAWELCRYVHEKVKTWAENNRVAPQTPVILWDEDEARSIEMVQVGSGGYEEQSSTEAPGLAVSDFNDAIIELQSAWGQWYTLKNSAPTPAIHTPHLWRHYQNMIVRYEELLRLGDPSGKKKAVRSAISALASSIRRAQRLLPSAQSTGNSLPMPEVLGVSAAWSKNADENLSEHFRELYKAEPNEYYKVWKKIESWVEESAENIDTKQLRQLMELRFSRWGFEALAKDPSADNLKKTASVLDWVHRRQGTWQTLWSKEAHLLVMLMHDALAPAQLAPDVLLHDALKIRILAEKTALAAPDNAGAAHPYSEEVWKWVRQEVEEADEERRLGEDWLFGSTEKHWLQAQTHFKKAFQRYKEARENAEVVRKAFQTRDRILAVLPSYAKWVAGQWIHEATAARRAEVKAWQDWVKQMGDDVDALADRLQKPTSGGDGLLKRLNDPAANVDSRSLVELTNDLDGSLKKLEAAFIEECRTLGEVQLQERWHDIQNVLAVPLIEDLDLRMKLLGNSKGISNKLHDSPLEKTKISAMDKTVQEELNKDRAQREGLMALAVAGKPWFGDFSKEQIRKSIDDVTLDNWRADLLHAGKHIRGQWKKRLEVIETGWHDSLVEGKLTEAAKPLQDSEVFCRWVAVGDVNQQIPSIPFDPVQAARRLNVHNLLCWQAERFWKDHWYLDPDLPNETYYQPAAKKFLNDAEQLAMTKPDLVLLNNERKKTAQNLEKQIKAAGINAIAVGGSTQHLMADKTFTLTWKFPPSDVPKGVPMFWLDLEGPFTESMSGQYQTRKPWGNWPLPSLPYTLTSEVYDEKDPPLVPESKSGTAQLTGVFRGQLIKSSVELDIHQGPDVIVSHYQPDAKAKLAVHLGKDVPYGSLCIVLDFSGSMGGNVGGKDKIEHVRAAFKSVLPRIPKDTNLSVLAFAGNQFQKFTWIREPAPWNPKPANIQFLTRSIAQLDPAKGGKWFSPIAEALVEAKEKGFPKLGGNRGPKILLALTDGSDTNFRGNINAAGTNPVQIQGYLLNQFGRSDIEINMVCFAGTVAEKKLAEDQFAVIESFDYPGIAGKFIIQDQPAKLAQTLEESLRPKLVLYHNAQRVSGFANGLLATRPDQNFNWGDVKIESVSGKDFTAKIQNLIKQDIRLRPGELMLLKVLRGPGASLKLQRSLFADNAKWAQTTPNGKWLAAVLQNKLDEDNSSIENLVTVENKTHLQPQFGSILQHDYPRFVWFELADGEGDAPEGFRWHGVYGYPAPAYRLEAGTFPGNVTPKLSLWLADQQNLPPNVAETYEWDALYPGAKLNVLDLSPLVVEKRPAQPELHYVTVGKGDRKEKACWVVQISYPKDKDGTGRKVWLQPDGIQYQGEEHLYFSKAGRYVALFWGGPRPERFRVISINRLKELPGVQWNLSSPNPKDKGPSIEKSAE